MNIDIDKSFFYKLHILKSSYDALTDRLLRQDAHINLTQFTILAVIKKFQPMNQQEIAVYIDITPGAISRQINAMQKEGLISIRHDKKDRRKQVVELSDKGLKTYETAAIRLREAATFLFGSEQKRAECIETMDELQQRIDIYFDK